jgi:hydroxymethylglutaryl-CoA lyase
METKSPNSTFNTQPSTLIKIIETPRDAFQGMKQFIPTEKKIRIIDLLLKAGFDTVEAGSFVSRKLIPQMADTSQVLRGIDKSGSNSRVMVLVVNKQGAMRAVRQGTPSCHPVPQATSHKLQAENQVVVDDLLFPFSPSATFLRRNLNSTLEQAKAKIVEVQEICDQYKKRLIVYLSMSFGNPYGDRWDPGIVEEYAGYLYELGLRVIPLSDILGEVKPETITEVYSRVTGTFPDVEFGFHLHSLPGHEYDKIDAAWKAGVRRFDTVTGGFGGCPMADDHMVANLNTFALVDYCEKNGIEHGIDTGILREVGKLMLNV